MLPKFHQEKLKQSVNLLTQLRSQLEEAEPASISSSEPWQQLQTIFQQEIFSLTEDIVEPSLSSAWQSFQTESHRCFRLLGTDLLFLASSNHERTKQQRLTQVQARLDQIINYCHHLLSSSGANP
jgi:hypothetical protein